MFWGSGKDFFVTISLDFALQSLGAQAIDHLLKTFTREGLVNFMEK